MQLEEVYGEVFRVLKPGGVFCSYEWVATKEYDPNNKEHVRIIDEINYGNGLPVSCTCMSDTVKSRTVNISHTATSESVAEWACMRVLWLGVTHEAIASAALESVSGPVMCCL